MRQHRSDRQDVQSTRARNAHDRIGVSAREIVVVGDITTVWHLAGPIIETEMRRYPLVNVPRLRPAQEGNKARLRSAVALIMNASEL